MPSRTLASLNRRIAACTRCPRLADYVASFGDDPAYWARPVPGFGDPRATLLVLGLAPGAHGANRTGRPFTGDAAGKFLYRALHEIGCSPCAESLATDDGLVLRGAYISNAVRCVPPQNKPTGPEVTECAPWLEDELKLLPHLRVVVALGKIAHDTFLRFAKRTGAIHRLADFKFAHAAVHDLGRTLPTLVDTYHSSRYNVNVGKLTWPMFKNVFEIARDLADRTADTG
ncbi:MAG: uracil-DNA glycosylase [Deltaproteobacteria bacterium]|jgi:uracil-DNA glycosylase family 4|nr:uracil-DNA glycosylase [Deltaproteobacteria bacterium]